MIIFHDPHCAEYSAPGYPERPERITRTVTLLKDQHRNWEWREPRAATDEELLRAHSREHHATRDRAMGFCYFSNVAVAALDALAVAGTGDAGSEPDKHSRSTIAATT